MKYVALFSLALFCTTAVSSSPLCTSDCIEMYIEDSSSNIKDGKRDFSHWTYQFPGHTTQYDVAQYGSLEGIMTFNKDDVGKQISINPYGDPYEEPYAGIIFYATIKDGHTIELWKCPNGACPD